MYRVFHNNATTRDQVLDFGHCPITDSCDLICLELRLVGIVMIIISQLVFSHDRIKLMKTPS